MAVTSGLAVAALQARDAARDQRREAEGLVAFMLGDLKDKLEPIGRLDALDGVGSRVLAYYSKQDASELSDAALLQRARALSLTADVAYLRGDLNSAQRLYGEAAQGTGEAVRRSPDDPQRLFDHAQNVFWGGEIARDRGQMKSAEAAFREYKALADRMVALEPDNLKWRMEVQYARENLGIVLMSQRRFAAAVREFEASLRPMESLASLDRENLEYQREVSNVLAWLADAHRALGNFNAAIALRNRQISFLRGLLARGVTDVALRDDLIPAHRALGLLWSWRGQLERGVTHYRMALAEANSLIAIEPDNSVWRDGAAAARLDLSLNLLALGQRPQAAQQVAAGCATVTALAAKDSSVARWRRLQTACLTGRSLVALRSGDDRQALALAQRALEAARSERSDDPVADRYKVAAAYRLLGDARERTGDRQGAAEAWSTGFAQLPPGAVERPWETSERADLLRRLGRTTEARPLAARLATIGYESVT